MQLVVTMMMSSTTACRLAIPVAMGPDTWAVIWGW